jgi:WD40 repeat protein
VSFDAPDSFAEVELSPDASRVIIQSFDLKTSLWNGLSGQKIRDLAVEDKISSVQFSFPGGPFLIVPLETPTTLWSNDGVQLATLGPAAGFAMQISRDGKRLVGLAGEELIGIWDSSQAPIAGSGEELRRQICTATGGHPIPRFTKQDRGARDPVASYLKGRPWTVCDWHPMSDGTGWSQTTRYWGVKIGLLPDYSDRE